MDQFASATRELADASAAAAMRRAEILAAAESRLDELVWQRRSDEAGVDLPRTFASPAGFVYRAPRGFDAAAIRQLEVIDIRRCRAVLGNSLNGERLSVRKYRLLIEALRQIDPPAPDGSTLRGACFEQLTKGLDRGQTDARLAQIGASRPWFRAEGNYVRSDIGPFDQLGNIFDSAYRHVMQRTSGEARPTEYRTKGGVLHQRLVGFTRAEIAEIDALNSRLQSKRADRVVRRTPGSRHFADVDVRLRRHMLAAQDEEARARLAARLDAERIAQAEQAAHDQAADWQARRDEEDRQYRRGNLAQHATERTHRESMERAHPDYTR